MRYLASILFFLAAFGVKAQNLSWNPAHESPRLSEILSTQFSKGPPIERIPVEDSIVRDATVRVHIVGYEPGSFTECSGVYIGNNKIVTATHCFEEVNRNHMYVIFKNPFGGNHGFECRLRDYRHYYDDVESTEASLFNTTDVTVAFIDPSITCVNYDGKEEDPTKLVATIKPFTISGALGEMPDLFAGYGAQRYGEHLPWNLRGLNLSELKRVTTREQVADLIDQLEIYEYGLAEKETNRLFGSIQSGKKTCYYTENDGLKTTYFGDSGGPGYKMRGQQPEIVSMFSVLLIREDLERGPKRVMAFCNTNLFYVKDWIENISL